MGTNYYLVVYRQRVSKKGIAYEPYTERIHLGKSGSKCFTFDFSPEMMDLFDFRPPRLEEDDSNAIWTWSNAQLKAIDREKLTQFLMEWDGDIENEYGDGLLDRKEFVQSIVPKQNEEIYFYTSGCFS